MTFEPEWIIYWLAGIMAIGLGFALVFCLCEISVKIGLSLTDRLLGYIEKKTGLECSNRWYR